MNVKTELKIHIGAHKTATTHLQDTLFQTKSTLENLKIKYLPRDEYRGRLSRFNDKEFRLIDKLTFGMSTRIYFHPIVINKLRSYNKVLISDENILGNTVDQLSTKPYLNQLPSRLYFIKRLSKYFDTTLYLSIRSFDGIYPGAYATALRFHPHDAMIAKSELIKSLINGEQPSWVDLVSSISSVLPKVTLKIWTQEDYRKHSNEIISIVTGSRHNDSVTVAPPNETITPNYKAIFEVENKVKGLNELPKSWTAMCDELYKKNQATTNVEKYSFLEKDIKTKLRQKYKDDLKQINYFWPEKLISFD